MTINEILDNGKIDIHEIPQIVLLISKIYQKNTTTKINLINIIRYTVEFILDMENDGILCGFCHNEKYN
jgi:hypothetical protein